MTPTMVRSKVATIFQPAGTNIEEHKNYIINSSGYFGYFENMKETPIVLKVVRTRIYMALRA